MVSIKDNIVNTNNKNTTNVDSVELKKQLSKAQELKKSFSKRTLTLLSPKNIIEVNKSTNEVEEFTKEGMELLKQGKVAVITMAGGQATRLGTNNPKGCYVIKGKSLFTMQKERLERLSNKVGKNIPWLVMTSEATHKSTVDYFEKEIEYPKVTFFKQDSIPALDKQGELIKADKQGNLFLAPNGNGGLFSALKSSGELEKLKAKNIKFLHVITVDNVLNKPADPVMLGAASLNKSDALSKSILRKNNEEKIGVFAMDSTKIIVAEYSELPKDNAAFVNANIANHLFSTEFVEEMTKKELPIHLAEKKIPAAEGMVEGFKLEKFVFDALPFANNPMVMIVERSNEFSPLKNATGADSPQTCADDLEKFKPKNDIEKLIMKP